MDGEREREMLRAMSKRWSQVRVRETQERRKSSYTKFSFLSYTLYRLGYGLGRRREMMMIIIFKKYDSRKRNHERREHTREDDDSLLRTHTGCDDDGRESE